MQFPNTLRITQPSHWKEKENNYGYIVGYDFTDNPDIVIIGDSDTVFYNKDNYHYKYYHELSEQYSIWTLCDFEWSNEQIVNTFEELVTSSLNCTYIIQLSFISRIGTTETGFSITNNPGVRVLNPISNLIDIVNENGIKCIVFYCNNCNDDEVEIYKTLFEDTGIQFIEYDRVTDKEYLDPVGHANDQVNKELFKLIKDQL